MGIEYFYQIITVRGLSACCHALPTRSGGRGAGLKLLAHNLLVRNYLPYYLPVGLELFAILPEVLKLFATLPAALKLFAKLPVTLKLLAYYP